MLIERVKVTGSRGRGIVFDGKDAGATANGNVVRNCVVSGTDGDGIELLAAESNLVEGCTITNAGGHGIQLNKASAIAFQPNKKSRNNTLRSNVISGAAQDGINISSGDGNQLIGNSISASGRDGVRIAPIDAVTCDANTLNGNGLSGSGFWGLRIMSALCGTNVVCTNNTYSANASGSIANFGTGTSFPSCAAVGGIAERPDVAASASSGRSPAAWIFGAGVALVAAAGGAAGWRRRRAATARSGL